MERYADLTRRHYKDSKVVLLVYDCDDMDSLELLEHVYDDAACHALDATKVLVRNKIDLEFQLVDIADADTKLRTDDRFACHMSTSAKTRDGIDALCTKLGDLLSNTKPVAKNDGAFQLFNHQPTQAPEDPAPDANTGSCC